MSENIFDKQDRERAKEYAQLGIDDVEGFGASIIKMNADNRIREEKITDEDEKLQVYQDVKQQWLEHKSKMKHQMEQERQKKKESEVPPPTTITIENKDGEKVFSVENDAIRQLREEIKSLDERLRKLEQYTEE